jgi:hypothetical protein
LPDDKKELTVGFASRLIIWNGFLNITCPSFYMAP